MDVLLIVDMQEASFSNREQYDTEGVVIRINELSAKVREQGGKVIFIQHDGTAEEGLLPGSPGWALLGSLLKDDSDFIIRKTLNDAFSKTDLDLCLRNLGVERLIISGWATDFCVDSTIRSAVGHNYNVVVASDCHTLRDRPHLKAWQVIEHHNWVWSGLLSECSAVRVAPLSEIFLEKSE